MNNMIDLRNKIKSIIDAEKRKKHFSVLDDNSVELIQQIFENYEHTNGLHQDMENIHKNAELIFVAAPTGAGKDNLVIKLNVQYPEKKYIELNMDIFRHYFLKFIPDVTKLSDKTFASDTNEFAYEIYFIIQQILLSEFPGTNIIITGTLRETDWVEETFRRYKANKLTNYTITLASLAVPKKDSAISVMKRYISIVDKQRKSSDFLPGTSRYTTLAYHDETYERFPVNLQYFENLFRNNPGELIDSMLVFRRSKKIDDYQEDTLVYSSEDPKYANKTALDAIFALRALPPAVNHADNLKLLQAIKENRYYLKEQGILRELVIDLGKLLGYKKIIDKKLGNAFKDDNNEQPNI